MGRYRYKIKTKHRNTPDGVKAIACTTLPCGYEIEETSTKPTRTDAEGHAKELVEIRVAGHRKWCRGPQSH